ncbi:MAG: response regulator [Phyllobacteriaceae bacterium]|nr:response regulator [Phyllobacteriaceae bacterium]
MNTILGMAKLLADTGLSPEQQTYVAAITSSGGSLLDLIEDLLDFSRIEAGRLDLAPASMSPRGLAEAVAELLSARAFAKGIGMAVTVAPGVPGAIMTDPGKARQVLVNLVGNAVKFTETGGVVIDVRLDASTLRFAVEDTGPGVAASDRERIFGDFEQADGSTTRNHGGVGLGLAISRRLAEAMGGGIAIEAGGAGGSTFVFSLPIEGAATAETIETTLSGRRVLVALPERVEAEAVVASIRALGGGARAVANAAEALALMADGAGFDTVLTGAGLEEGAPGLLATLRGAKPSLRGLALLTPGQRGRMPELRARGYDGYLVRPVRLATLSRLAGRLDLPTEAPPTARSAAPGVAGALRILVAEDNPVNALLVRVALEKAGHRVDVVGDGRAAVAAAGSAAFDAVLMDLHMPVMDGLDAIDRIRSGEEARSQRPRRSWC